MSGGSEITKVCNNTKVPGEVVEDAKHPLEDSWCVWLYTCDYHKWGQNLVNLTTFDTVEDYWCLYHHMKLPSELQHGQDYAVFKKGISPTWEDPANKNGGRWIINVDKRISDLDCKFLITILVLIGAMLEHKDAVCGVIANVRSKKNKIGVWVTDSENDAAILSIGKEIKRQLGIQGRINFHKHSVPIVMHMI